MIGAVLDNEIFHKGMDRPVSLPNGRSITRSQSRKSSSGGLELLLPQVDCGTADAKGVLCCFEAVLITKLDNLDSALNSCPFRVVEDVVNVLHETTIAVSVVTIYVNLLHPDSLFSPYGSPICF